MIGIIGILFALLLLMYLAYRGFSVLLLAPLLALLAVMFSLDAPILASYTQVFMKALGNFIVLYFPLFLLGAVFGKLIEASGSANTIAQWIVGRLGRGHAIFAIVLSCAVLTYGGVSLFVVAFAVYPIAAALFRQADVPKRLIPASIGLGAFTFTMTALPGTPAIQNAIPMPYFGTTPFAAPGLGIIAGIIMLAFGIAWLMRRAAHAARSGEGYGEANIETPDTKADPAFKQMPVQLSQPGIVVAMLPVVLVVALNYVFSTIVFAWFDTTYLAQAKYGPATLNQVVGVWSIICALFFSSLTLLALNFRRITDIRNALDEGANASMLPIFNTASLVGFGAVIASLPAFGLIRDTVLDIAPGNPLISLAVAVNILAGITGSASGGMSIALQTLGANYLELARSAGISPELMHRVTAIATGGLDALPHNGAVITLLSICKLSHRTTYLDIFMVAVIGPIAALVTVIVFGTWLGSF